MKMYILVKDSIPLGLAITAVAHAAAAAMDKWRYDATFVQWKNTSFKKVVCKVSNKEFTEAIDESDKLGDNDKIIMSESALNGDTTAAVFKPRNEWPKSFRFYSLYK